jgi:hypothetical protein
MVQFLFILLFKQWIYEYFEKVDFRFPFLFSFCFLDFRGWSTLGGFWMWIGTASSQGMIWFFSQIRGGLCRIFTMDIGEINWT